MASHSLMNRRRNLFTVQIQHKINNDRNGSGDEQQFVRCEGRLISVPRRMRLLEVEGCDDIKMSKLLFNVQFQRSLGVVQVVMSTEAAVRDLIIRAVEIYLREKRRPLLHEPVDALCFELHYSPFCFECLDPNQKLMRMTSRNCYVCTKPVTRSTSAS